MTFGVGQFELALMHRMRDLNPERVEVALHELGATRADLRDAHARWTRMAYAPGAPKGAAALRRILGPPAYRGVTRTGSLTCDVLRWALPSWPGLEFEALIGPGGEVWNQWFVRPRPRAAPAFGELLPWRCVVADFATLPGAVQREGGAPHHWTAGFTHEGARYRALFVYGLLQRLEPG